MKSIADEHSSSDYNIPKKSHGSFTDKSCLRKAVLLGVAGVIGITSVISTNAVAEANIVQNRNLESSEKQSYLRLIDYLEKYLDAGRDVVKKGISAHNVQKIRKKLKPWIIHYIQKIKNLADIVGYEKTADSFALTDDMLNRVKNAAKEAGYIKSMRGTEISNPIINEEPNMAKNKLSIPTELSNLGIEVGISDDTTAQIRFPYKIKINGRSEDLNLPYGKTTVKPFNWNGKKVFDIRIESNPTQHYVLDVDNEMLYVYYGETFKTKVPLINK